MACENPCLDVVLVGRAFGDRPFRFVEQDTKTGEETVHHAMSFFPGAVFDITQTELDDPEAPDSSTITHQLTGNDPKGIYTATADWLTAQGWTVEREKIPGQTNGYTTTNGTHRVASATVRFPKPPVNSLPKTVNITFKTRHN